MTAAETESRDEVDLDQIWRAEQLELAGYNTAAAAQLATRHDVDLHGAIELLSVGCPAELALKILL
jgi:hypothetical protein